MTDTLNVAPEVGASVLIDNQNWTAQDAADLYHLDVWGEGYFSVDEEGHVASDHSRTGSTQIAIARVVERLKQRGVTLPVLIRFQDILRERVAQINTAFRDSIEELGYTNRYIGVYPIKVNQLHEVVEEVLDAGRPFGVGLECGSKAELVATIPHLDSDETLLICNGYKDRDMLQLIVSLQKLGKNVIPVVEKFDEYELLTDVADKLMVNPKFGVRVRLSAAGSGKWADSGGDLSKFGVSMPELIEMVRREKDGGEAGTLRLLHFHMGSQISDIQALRRAVKEIAQIFVQLRKRDIEVQYLDVGGGLGVNYEGELAGTGNAINYTLQEYANAVVQSVREVCDAETIEHPVLISESGRALTAHHSVLALEVAGSYAKHGAPTDFVPAEVDHQLVHDMWNTLDWMASDNSLRPAELLEAYHDAVANRQEADTLFSFGYLPLEQKALTDQLFWSVCQAINSRLQDNPPDSLPDELITLNHRLVEQYLCNFSVFQSMLDHWAIGQRFPAVPLQHLNRKPDRKAVLVDLTCDSDGKIHGYVTSNDENSYLSVHELKDEPYYIGIFLMGAYQDIMGDSHNLFGRVAEAHVYFDETEPDNFYIEKTIPSTTIEEMLALVQYFPSDLFRRMETIVKSKVEQGLIKPTAGVQLLDEYRSCFGDSTYLQR